jgi:hypothetical protein
MTDANLDHLIRTLGRQIGALGLLTADLPPCDLKNEIHKAWYRVLGSFQELQEGLARRPDAE